MNAVFFRPNTAYDTPEAISVIIVVSLNLVFECSIMKLKEIAHNKTTVKN